MSPTVLEELRRLWALRKLDFVTASDVVQWASERVAYEDGLTAVACLSADASSEEIDDAVQGALEEAGDGAVSDEAAARLIACEVLNRIVDGTTEPFEAARQLWAVARRVPAIEPTMRPFIGLASEWEDSAAHRNEYDDDIVEQAILALDLGQFYLMFGLGDRRHLSITVVLP